MGRKPLTVKDGPLEGKVYELDLAVDEQVRLRLPEGGFAVHRVQGDPDYVDSTGHHVPCLVFVAIEPAE
jgi:hypothetical protein